MSADADLIYNACLRAERRIEERVKAQQGNPTTEYTLHLVQSVFQTLREEIGTGIARERP